MFDKLTDMFDNALGVVDDTLFGEGPSRRSVAKLLADGVSVAVIAATFNVGIDVIENLMGDEA